MRKRLDQLIGTVSVSLIDDSNKIEKEMALIKVKAGNGEKVEMIQLIDIYKGNIVDTTPDGLVVMLVGSRQKVDRFLNLLPEQEVCTLHPQLVLHATCMNQNTYGNLLWHLVILQNATTLH